MGNYGTGIQHRTIERCSVTIDGKNSTISAEIPEDCDYGDIYTNPAKMLKENREVLPSLSLIRYGKVKPLIDGAYASAEMEIAKTGNPFSRPDFLSSLQEVLRDKYAKNYVDTAIILGSGGRFSSKHKRSLEIAEESPDISLVQGFYDWGTRIKRCMETN